MLGFDALSLPFVQAHLDELPTFKRLFARGALIQPEAISPPAPGQPLLPAKRSVSTANIFHSNGTRRI
jgi:hypothetical protein